MREITASIAKSKQLQSEITRLSNEIINTMTITEAVTDIDVEIDQEKYEMHIYPNLGKVRITQNDKDMSKVKTKALLKQIVEEISH